MHRVELVYDEDCPHVPGARAAIVRAFCEVGLTPRWSEWSRTSPTSPLRVRGFGSPTVLVDGVDVAGDAGQALAGSCRLYTGPDGRRTGVPRADVIAGALRRSGDAGKCTERRRGARSVVASALGPLALLLPLGVCAACWPAYSALLSFLGIGFLLSEPYLLPVALVLVTVAVASLLFDAWPRGHYGPAVLGIAASSFGLAGKFLLGNAYVTIAGSAGLVAAALWSARPRRGRDGVACDMGRRPSADRAADGHPSSPATRIG